MQIELITVGCVCADVIVRPVDTYPERGHLQLLPDLEIHLGGLAGVTAAVFAQLGGKSALIGKLGADGFGDYIIGALIRAGVNTEHVRRVKSEHTSATIVLVTSEGERTFLHHLGTNGTTTPGEIDIALAKRSNAFHWGGPGVTPGLTGEGMGAVFRELREPQSAHVADALNGARAHVGRAHLVGEQGQRLEHPVRHPLPRGDREAALGAVAVDEAAQRRGDVRVRRGHGRMAQHVGLVVADRCDDLRVAGRAEQDGDEVEERSVRRRARVEVADQLGDAIFRVPPTAADHNPERPWVTRAAYLSGNVRSKLTEARTAALTDPEIWQHNVDALVAVVPADIQAGDIHANLGAVWIPARDHEAFLRDMYGQSPADVLHLMDKAGYDATHLATDHEAHWRFTPR